MNWDLYNIIETTILASKMNFKLLEAARLWRERNSTVSASEFNEPLKP